MVSSSGKTVKARRLQAKQALKHDLSTLIEYFLNPHTLFIFDNPSGHLFLPHGARVTSSF